MDKHFINKENLTRIYSKIIKNMNIKPNNDQKDQMVKIAHNNMKKVFNNINKSKITQVNFDKAVEAFREKTVEKAVEDIKKYYTMNVPQMTERQFQRDQDLYSGRKVNIDTRAKSSESFMISQPGQKRLDNQFEPLINEPNIDDYNKMYNNINNDGKINTEKSLEQLQRMREIDIPIQNKKPQTPEWILNGRDKGTKKPDINTSFNTASGSNNNGNNSTGVNNAQNGHGDIRGFGNDDGALNAFSDSNFGLSITNGDDTGKFNDNIKIEDKLKMYQKQRENVDSNIEKFTNNDNTTVVDDNIDYQLNQFNSKRIQQQKQKQLEEQQYQLQQLKMMEKKQFIREDSDDNQEFMEMVKKNQQYIQKIQELKITNENLLNEIQLVKQETRNVEYEKTEQLKKSFLPKINEYKKLMNEVTEKTIELQQRENSLIEKEYKMKQLVQQYESTISTKTYQIIINSKQLGENFDEYVYPLAFELNNVIKFSLSSYSIPEPKYNIEDHNNVFEYEINSETKNITIKLGAYTITRLIDVLNKNVDLKFDLVDNFIKVNSENEFKIIENDLSRNVLGFSDNYESSSTEHLASNLWDLRYRDHVILKVSNIVDEDFLCCLTYNGKSEALIEFETPITIGQLGIKFVDNDDNKVKFYNQHHILIFRAECVKEDMSDVINRLTEINVS